MRFFILIFSVCCWCLVAATSWKNSLDFLGDLLDNVGEESEESEVVIAQAKNEEKLIGSGNYSDELTQEDGRNELFYTNGKGADLAVEEQREVASKLAENAGSINGREERSAGQEKEEEEVNPQQENLIISHQELIIQLQEESTNPEQDLTIPFQESTIPQQQINSENDQVHEQCDSNFFTQRVLAAFYRIRNQVFTRLNNLHLFSLRVQIYMKVQHLNSQHTDPIETESEGELTDSKASESPQLSSDEFNSFFRKFDAEVQVYQSILYSQQRDIEWNSNDEKVLLENISFLREIIPAKLEDKLKQIPSTFRQPLLSWFQDPQTPTENLTIETLNGHLEMMYYKSIAFISVIFEMTTFINDERYWIHHFAEFEDKKSEILFQDAKTQLEQGDLNLFDEIFCEDDYDSGNFKSEVAKFIEKLDAEIDSESSSDDLQPEESEQAEEINSEAQQFSAENELMDSETQPVSLFRTTGTMKIRFYTRSNSFPRESQTKFPKQTKVPTVLLGLDPNLLNRIRSTLNCPHMRSKSMDLVNDSDSSTISEAIWDSIHSANEVSLDSITSSNGETLDSIHSVNKGTLNSITSANEETLNSSTSPIPHSQFGSHQNIPSSESIENNHVPKAEPVEESDQKEKPFFSTIRGIFLKTSLIFSTILSLVYLSARLLDCTLTLFSNKV